MKMDVDGCWYPDRELTDGRPSVVRHHNPELYNLMAKTEHFSVTFHLYLEYQKRSLFVVYWKKNAGGC